MKTWKVIGVFPGTWQKINVVVVIYGGLRVSTEFLSVVDYL